MVNSDRSSDCRPQEPVGINPTAPVGLKGPKMVQSPVWKKLVQEREEVDHYRGSDRFAASRKDEQIRMTPLMKELGLA